MLDALDHAVHQVTDQAAEHHAANSFVGEQHGRGAQARCFAQLHDAQQHGEHHNGGAVIEQRLTDDGGFQWLGGIGRTQHAEHGNRIGGGDQCTEQQAVQEADMPAEQAENPVRQAADHRSGNQYADRGQ